MSEPKSNRKIWLVFAIILGGLLLAAAGFAIGQSFLSPPAYNESGRNPSAEGIVSIQAFSLAPERIRKGECTTISWTIINAEVVTLSRQGELIYNGLMVDSFQDCPDQTGVIRYRLDANNSQGRFYNWSELMVIVE